MRSFPGENGAPRMLEQIQQFLLHYFTWWNGANFNTRFYTRRFGVLVGHDEFGNTYYHRPGAWLRAAVGDLQWRGRGLDDSAGLERVAPSHGRRAADRGRLQGASLGTAAHRKPDRHAGRDSARRLDPQTGPAPADRGRLRGLEPWPLRRTAFIPPPLSSKAPPMDLFRLAKAFARRACPAIARMRPTLAGATLAALLALAVPGAALADKISNPIAVFNGLDKITGR